MDLEKLLVIQDKCINDDSSRCIQCEAQNSEYFELVKHEPNHNKSTYVFFPGCQLSAYYSEEVFKTYVYLTEILPGSVGIYLGCCGAPADFARQSELFNSSMKKIQENLEKMGNPIVITACPTCFNNFSKGLKNIRIRSLWEIFLEEGIPEEAIKGDGKTLMVYDACTTREEKEIHKSIKKIAENLGYKIEEPYYTKETSKCCSLEGNIFILSGKKNYHILDILFGNDKNEISNLNVLSLYERCVNRLKMKKYMLETLWGEKMEVNGLVQSCNNKSLYR